MNDVVEHETELDAPPEKVWRALETPELRDAWLAPAEVPAEQGGPIETEVIEARPPNHLRVAWRSRDGELDTVVTFTVSPSGAGSRLRIVHAPRGAQRMELKRAA